MSIRSILGGKYFKVGLLLASLIVVFLSVYFLAKPTGGFVPAMPNVTIDNARISFSVKRLKKRAASVKLESYHRELLAAFQAFNNAEAGGKDEKEIEALRLVFVDRTMIAQTAQKERYLLLGDFLAVQFEKHLFAVLKELRQMGLGEVTGRRSEDYRKLVALSGNFLANSVRIGLISKRGELNTEKYVPQILFRKRWRILGDIPFRLHFLQIESLVDAVYMLQFGNAANTSQRLEAVKRIEKQDDSFDSAIAKGLVLYQGRETKRAKLVLEKAKKQRPNDFVINEFLLFLSNGTN